MANFLSEAARHEFGYFSKSDRLNKVKVRIDRVEKMIAYFAVEEEREQDLYSLGMAKTEMFSTKMRVIYDVEASKVIASANRNAGPKKNMRSRS